MSKVKSLSADEALEKLKAGNKNYVADKLNRALQDSSRREDLTGGQAPYAIVLSCADSRVVPELTFDAGLGELFVIRIAGNIANTSTIASIEYAVAHLGTKLIVVLGHENCGAVTAAVAGGDNGYNLNHLLAHISPSIAASRKKDVNSVVKKNAKMTCDDLVNRSAIITKAVEKKSGVKIVPAYYNLGTGKVNFL
jgi:carbonic anhydrase